MATGENGCGSGWADKQRQRKMLPPEKAYLTLNGKRQDSGLGALIILFSLPLFIASICQAECGDSSIVCKLTIIPMIITGTIEYYGVGTLTFVVYIYFTAWLITGYYFCFETCFSYAPLLWSAIAISSLSFLTGTLILVGDVLNIFRLIKIRHEFSQKNTRNIQKACKEYQPQMKAVIVSERNIGVTIGALQTEVPENRCQPCIATWRYDFGKTKETLDITHSGALDELIKIAMKLKYTHIYWDPVSVDKSFESMSNTTPVIRSLWSLYSTLPVIGYSSDPHIVSCKRIWLLFEQLNYLKQQDDDNLLGLISETEVYKGSYQDLMRINSQDTEGLRTRRFFMLIGGANWRVYERIISQIYLLLLFPYLFLLDFLSFLTCRKVNFQVYLDPFHWIQYLTVRFFKWNLGTTSRLLGDTNVAGTHFILLNESPCPMSDTSDITSILPVFTVLNPFIFQYSTELYLVGVCLDFVASNPLSITSLFSSVRYEETIASFTYDCQEHKVRTCEFDCVCGEKMVVSIKQNSVELRVLHSFHILSSEITLTKFWSQFSSI